MSTVKKSLEILDLKLPTVGMCSLFPVHSLPITKQMYFYARHSARCAGLMELPILTLPEKNELVSKLLPSVAKHVFLMFSGERLCIPTRRRLVDTETNCVACALINTDRYGNIFIVHEDVPTMRNVSDKQPEIWCIFRSSPF